MPYHKSCLKQIRGSKKRNLRNRMVRSRMNTAIGTMLAAKDKPAAAETLKLAFSMIDRSVKAGILHKRNAAHKKARLAKLANNIKN